MVAKIAKKRKTKTVPSYAAYIQKVLKQVFPAEQDQKIGMSAQAVEIVNSLLVALEAQLSAKAGEVANIAKKSTLSARHVQTATALLLPSELAKVAITEATKSVSRFAEAA